MQPETKQETTIEIVGDKQHESLLVSIPKSRTIKLDFNVSAFVPINPAMQQPGQAAQQKQGDAPKEKQVLFNVAGSVEPGQILALMGPSGSGKSSLLTVLCGRSTARVGGDVLFNGQPLTKAVKKQMGWVSQDDLLFAELTTYETLYYAAMLRLPRDWSKEQKIERVEMVLQGLGLDNCRNTIIGNHFMRGVSGGERKRVSIGHELLINPSVILLDEPTSGLDSTTALNVMQTMRGLATGGRTIIASIHQPSSRIYQEMDQLLLLSEGHTLYYGGAQECAKWFDLQGTPVPFGVNTADHILDLACGDLPGRSTQESKAIQQRLIHAFENRTIGLGRTGVRAIDFDANADKKEAKEGLTESLMVPPSGWNKLQNSDGSMSEAEEGKVQPASQPEVVIQVGTTKGSDTETDTADAAEGSESRGATWTQQVSILTSRCVRVRSTEAFSVQSFAKVVIPAILAGLFWFQIGGKDTLTKQGILDLSGLLFFTVIFNSFQAMFGSIFTFPGDFAMLKKERSSSMYQLTAYYAARSISDVPMECLIPALFTIIIYWFSGLRISAGAFFANLFSVILCVLTAQSQGLLIGATVMNPKTGLALCTIYMLAVLLIAGYLVRNVPIWIRWMKYASFIYYGYNLLLKIEFNHRGYSCTDFYIDNPSAPKDLSWCSIKDGDVLPINVNKPVTLEVCLLLAFFIISRVLVYYALRHHTSFKQ